MSSGPFPGLADDSSAPTVSSTIPAGDPPAPEGNSPPPLSQPDDTSSSPGPSSPIEGSEARSDSDAQPQEGEAVPGPAVIEWREFDPPRFLTLLFGKAIALPHVKLIAHASPGVNYSSPFKERVKSFRLCLGKSQEVDYLTLLAWLSDVHMEHAGDDGQAPKKGFEEQEELWLEAARQACEVHSSHNDVVIAHRMLVCFFNQVVPVWALRLHGLGIGMRMVADVAVDVVRDEYLLGRLYEYICDGELGRMKEEMKGAKGEKGEKWKKELALSKRLLALGKKVSEGDKIWAWSWEIEEGLMVYILHSENPQDHEDVMKWTPLGYAVNSFPEREDLERFIPKVSACRANHISKLTIKSAKRDDDDPSSDMWTLTFTDTKEPVVNISGEAIKGCGFPSWQRAVARARKNEEVSEGKGDRDESEDEEEEKGDRASKARAEAEELRGRIKKLEEEKAKKSKALENLKKKMVDKEKEKKKEVDQLRAQLAQEKHKSHQLLKKEQARTEAFVVEIKASLSKILKEVIPNNEAQVNRILSQLIPHDALAQEDSEEEDPNAEQTEEEAVDTQSEGPRRSKRHKTGDK
jgi:hypothetical protein